MRNVQLPTKNEKFIYAVKNAQKNKQKKIAYWCNTKVISIENKPNQDLIGEEIDLTEIGPLSRVISKGKIVDVIQDTIENIYNNSNYGGNQNLGLPKNYDLNDFLYEINETMDTNKGNYRVTDLIGACIIEIDYLPVDRKPTYIGNQLGIKNI